MSRLLTPAEIAKLHWDNWTLYAHTAIMQRQTAFTVNVEPFGDLVIYRSAAGPIFYNVMAPEDAGIVAEVRKPEYQSPGGSIVEILEGMARDTVALTTNLVYGAGLIVGVWLLFQLTGGAARR